MRRPERSGRRFLCGLLDVSLARLSGTCPGASLDLKPAFSVGGY
jgi:hypothetical protein